MSGRETDVSIHIQEPTSLEPPFSPEHNLLSALEPSSSSSSSSSRNTSFSAFPPPLADDQFLVPSSTVIPRSTLPTYLSSELSIPRLDGIRDILWFAARPRQPDPLHTQQRKERTVIITTRPDRHLVVWRGGCYLKPLPRFLLDHDFFATHLCGPSTPEESSLHANACGLLQSYVDLIVHECDFKLAVDLGLVPAEIPWMRWAAFAADVRDRIGQPGRYRVVINPRYHYGELDRQQLNWLCWYQYGWAKRYYFIYNDYVDFCVGNFTQLVLIFAYASVLLSAMELVLGTQKGQDGAGFEGMSYYVGMVFVAVVLGGVAVLGGVFLVYFLLHFAYRKKKKDREWRMTSWAVEGAAKRS